MEVKNGYKHQGIICLYEMFGMMLLTTTINWSSANSDFHAFSAGVGFTFGVLASIFSVACGVNVNPSVSIGVFMMEGPKNYMRNIFFLFKILFA